MRIVLLIPPVITNVFDTTELLMPPLITSSRTSSKCNPLLAFSVFACRFYKTTLKPEGRWIFIGRLQAALILLVSKMFIRTSMQGVTVCWSLWNGEFSDRERKLEWLVTYVLEIFTFFLKPCVRQTW